MCVCVGGGYKHTYLLYLGHIRTPLDCMLCWMAALVLLAGVRVAFGQGQWYSGKCRTALSLGKINQPTNQATNQPTLQAMKITWCQLGCQILENLKISSHEQGRAGSGTARVGHRSLILLSRELIRYWLSPEQCKYETYRCCIYFFKKSGIFLMLLPRTACTCQCDYLFIF